MEITKTLLINAACLLIPPVVVVLLLRHFFPREIRWSAGVVALVDLVVFWTDISYYESVWLTLFLFHRSQNTIDGAHQRIPDHSILFLQRNDTRFQAGGFLHSLNEKIQFIQLCACGLQKLLTLFFCQWPCQHRIVDQLQICDGGFGLVGNI